MKKVFVMLIVFVIGGIVGSQFEFSAWRSGEMNESSNSGDKKPLYWVAPMDKNYRRDGPGLSPMGMDLVPVYEEEVSGANDNSIKISPAVENNLGVKTSKVTRERLIMPVETIGTVQFDESSIAHIHSRVEGWIETLNVASSGSPVKKGQILFELYSPTLVNAQEEYLAALRSGNRNLIKASKSRLISLGLSEAQTKRLERRRKVDQRISFLADRDGVVIDLNVRQGMHIKPSVEVLSIGSLDSVWIIGEVFERQAYLVEQGQIVEIELSAMPGKTWEGSVNYIYPQLDPKTRTLSVRVRVNNADHALKPNMLANLRVLNATQEETLSIPRQALIKAGNHARVVKALGNGRYQSVLVQVGLEGEGNDNSQDKVQILKGLAEGDLVVTSSQFLIDSESNIDAEMLRMEERAQAEETAPSNPPSNKVMASGKVNKVMSDMGMVNITHDPIPEWDWPMMSMSFVVDKNENLPNLKVGDEIVFALKESQDGDYEISNVKLK